VKRWIYVSMADGSTRTYAVEKRVTKIGRASDNDVVLLDGNRSVSRWHATIVSEDDGSLSVEDLQSMNKTLVNGQEIKGSVRINPNDVIAVGRFKISIREESADRFDIRSGALTLDEAQKTPELLTFVGLPSATPSEVKNLELLYEVGVTLARSHSLDDVTNAAVEMLFKIDQVHRATVMMWSDETQSFSNTDLHMRNAGKTSSLPASYDPKNLVMSRTILNRVRDENRALIIRDTSGDESFNAAMSIVRAGIQAAFCSPLTFQGRFLGILYADNLADPKAFSEADFRTFTSIAAQTGLALANAIANQELLKREVERQALKRYLPPQIADMIIASGGLSQLTGVLQPVTVVYTDIRGFTSIAERMDARETVAMLRHFFSLMSAAVLECNGTVDKFIGDCIMALFGAPVESETATRDALRAAILMQQRMKELNEARLADYAAPIEIGIGMHRGPAVVGNIGSEDRVQYTAIGDTVNIAARLVSRAGPSQIIVSENIRSELLDYRGFEPLGEMELKGRAGKLNTFLVRWTEVPLE